MLYLIYFCLLNDVFLEQEPIAEEQTISPQEQGMNQQGNETYVVETTSCAPRLALLPPNMLFESNMSQSISIEGT